jgi:hypothetical protein
MVQYEKGHIRNVKKPYMGTSRNNLTVQSEVMHRVQIKRIYSDNLEIYRKEFKKRIKTDEERKKVPLSYITANDVKYTYYKMPITSQRLFFQEGHWDCLGPKERPFLSPISNMTELDIILNNNLPEILGLNLDSNLKRNSSKCSLSLVSNFCIESSTMSIPDTTLCCNRLVNSKSGDSSESYMRFDWIRWDIYVYLNIFYVYKYFKCLLNILYVYFLVVIFNKQF